MLSFLEKTIHLIDMNKLITVLYAAGLLVVGWFVAKKLSVLAEHSVRKRFSRHHTLLLRRFIFYIIFALFFMSSLQSLGFKLSVLLGAAGVFTVAISFASQTAASNLISGIFLLFERPFKVGDSVHINGINGTVDSIDLLSTKLKTTENTRIRIPNESMMKSEITNLSYFSTRLINVIITVNYNTDIPQVKSIILAIADQCPSILKTPAPAVNIDDFTSYGIKLNINIWVKTIDATTIKPMLQELIKIQFDKQGINGLCPTLMTAINVAE